MAKKIIGFDAVREVALVLPDVKESTIHGAPSLNARGRLLACPALHSSAEPNTLMVRIDFDRRAELMKAEPDVYYLTNHYANHPSVLVRLSHIDRTALKDLLDYAWRFVNSRTNTTKRRGRGVRLPVSKHGSFSMQISATVINSLGEHTVSVRTGDQVQTLPVPSKAVGGSGVNGGEFLMLALASCYCNDLYREANRLGISLQRVEVEAFATFAGVGIAGSDVR